MPDRRHGRRCSADQAHRLPPHCGCPRAEGISHGNVRASLATDVTAHSATQHVVRTCAALRRADLSIARGRRHRCRLLKPWISAGRGVVDVPAEAAANPLVHPAPRVHAPHARVGAFSSTPAVVAVVPGRPGQARRARPACTSSACEHSTCMPSMHRRGRHPCNRTGCDRAGVERLPRRRPAARRRRVRPHCNAVCWASHCWTHTPPRARRDPRAAYLRGDLVGRHLRREQGRHGGRR